MLGKTHTRFGVAFGLSSLYVMDSIDVISVDPILSSAYLYFVYKGSSIPDIDHPNSTISQNNWLLSKIISALFGHRKFTHSILFIILFSAIQFILVLSLLLGSSYVLMEYMSLNPFGHFEKSPLVVSLYLSFGLAIGMLSHIIGDSFTKRGVKVLTPFSQKSFKLPFTFKTGGLFEKLFSNLLIVFNAMFIGLLIYTYWLTVRSGATLIAIG